MFSTDLHGLTSEFQVAVVTMATFTYMEDWLFNLCNILIDIYSLFMENVDLKCFLWCLMLVRRQLTFFCNATYVATFYPHETSRKVFDCLNQSKKCVFYIQRCKNAIYINLQNNVIIIIQLCQKIICRSWLRAFALFTIKYEFQNFSSFLVKLI